MININKRFSFERDQHNWKLHETTRGRDKEGNPKDQVKTTYHANLEQVCYAVLDRCAGECESLEELISLFRNAKSEILIEALKKADKCD